MNIPQHIIRWILSFFSSDEKKKSVAVINLAEKLKSIPKLVIEERGADCFEHGMTLSVFKMVDSVIDSFYSGFGKTKIN
jgi:hypothetical protein